MELHEKNWRPVIGYSFLFRAEKEYPTAAKKLDKVYTWDVHLQDRFYTKKSK